MRAVRGLGDDAIQLFHLGRVTNQLAETLLRAQLLAQQPVLGGQLQVLGHASQLQAKLVEVEGLGDVVVSAQLHGLHRGLHRGKTGHHDGDRFGPAPLDVAQNFQAAAVRQAQVEQDDVDVGGVQKAVGLVARFRQQNIEAQRLRHVTAALAYRALVLYDQ